MIGTPKNQPRRRLRLKKKKEKKKKVLALNENRKQQCENPLKFSFSHAFTIPSPPPSSSSSSPTPWSSTRHFRHLRRLPVSSSASKLSPATTFSSFTKPASAADTLSKLSFASARKHNKSLSLRSSWALSWVVERPRGPPTSRSFNDDGGVEVEVMIGERRSEDEVEVIKEVG
jgi:hypothetical protein